MWGDDCTWLPLPEPPWAPVSGLRDFHPRIHPRVHSCIHPRVHPRIPSGIPSCVPSVTADRAPTLCRRCHRCWGTSHENRPVPSPPRECAPSWGDK